jgi:hypothetical protein
MTLRLSVLVPRRRGQYDATNRMAELHGFVHGTAYWKACRLISSDTTWSSKMQNAPMKLVSATVLAALCGLSSLPASGQGRSTLPPIDWRRDSIADTHLARAAKLEASDAEALDLAVALFVRKEILHNARTQFDPSKNGWGKRPSIGRRKEHGEAIAAVLGADIVNADSVITCAGGRRSCELVKPGALVTIDAPLGNSTSDRVTVNVHHFSQGVTRGPRSLSIETWTLYFVKKNNKWTFDSWGPLSSS